jgi:hypothetical protein
MMTEIQLASQKMCETKQLWSTYITVFKLMKTITEISVRNAKSFGL